MTKKEFNQLKVGDQVKHYQNSMFFVITDVQENHITAVNTVCMRIPNQWEKVKGCIDENNN